MVAKKKTVARKTVKKKAVSKKTTQAPAKKKAASKKPASPRAGAKKKAPAKKAPAKKAAAKKAPAKKAAAKKVLAKKAAAKKAPAKKALAQKTTRKKAVAKSSKKEVSAVAIAPPKRKSLGKLVIKRKSNGNGNGSLAQKDGKKRSRKLTPKQLRDFKQVLVVMRDQLAGQVTSLRGDSLQRHDEVNTSEDGTDAFERQFALKLASTEQDGIYEIDEALRRIDAGTFGICEMSGDPIELERLRAIPFTRHSLAAQAEIESHRGPYRQSAVRRTLA